MYAVENLPATPANAYFHASFFMEYFNLSLLKNVSVIPSLIKFTVKHFALHLKLDAETSMKTMNPRLNLLLSQSGTPKGFGFLGHGV